MKAASLVLVIFLGFLGGCSSTQSSSASLGSGSGQKRPLSDTVQCSATFQIADTQRMGCTRDQDCQIVQSDCCGCNANGTQTAVLSSKAAEVLACKAMRCGDIMCAQMISQDQSCQKSKAICRSGFCELQ